MTSALLERPGVRFLLSGGIVAVWSMSTTTTLRLSGSPFQIALVAGFVSGVGLHFVLHRYFTYRDVDVYALNASSQARRFVLTSVGQYLVLAVGVASIVAVIEVDDLVVYYGLIVLLSLGNFLVTRHLIFHGARDVTDPPR